MKPWVKMLCAALGIWSTSLSAANDDWWFDIEVIVFDRGMLASELDETLPQVDLGPLSSPLQDPIFERLFPSTGWLAQAWPACEYPSDIDKASPDIAWVRYLPDWLSSHCDLSPLWSTDVLNNKQTFHLRREQIGVVVEGLEWEIPPKTHLLPSTTFALSDISQRIRSTRGLTRLLHVAWRQPVVFGRDNAIPVRIFGGRNYAPKEIAFTESALEVPAEDTAVEVISAYESLAERLRQPTPVPFSAFQEIHQQQQHVTEASGSEEHIDMQSPDRWQLDGHMRVYLRYINKVPYLHVEPALQYRQPDATEQLQIFTLEETRRVISKQLHYFDHPLFGVVMQIRRFQFPPSLTQGNSL